MLPKEKLKIIQASISNAQDSNLPRIFSALSDPGRFQIFNLLLKHKDVCVSDIASILNTTVPAASQQLKILELVGLVKREREGQMICYKIAGDNPTVKSIIKLI